MIRRTFFIVKPDVVAAGKFGEVMDVILREGFEVKAMRQLTLTPAKVDELYAEHVGRDYYAAHSAFMASGPCVVMVLQREDAVGHLRTISGASDPERAHWGTLRHTFGTALPKNGTHSSDSEPRAAVESLMFFTLEELSHC